MTFSENEITTLIDVHYGIHCSVTQLNGYEELNYRLQDSLGKKFLLKITPPGNNNAFIDAQVKIMQHLSKSAVSEKIQHCLPDKKDNFVVSFLHREEVYNMRLLNFLEGTFWVDMKDASTIHAAGAGSFLGKMDKSLEDFYHPAMQRYYEWDISNALDARVNLKHIKDPEKRRITAYFLLQFETEVLPLLHALRKAPVHNDANDYNLLLKGTEVSGLIDFGDMVHTALINNVAIACTYIMLGQKDPLAMAEAFVKAYHQEYPLREEELRILYYLIAARLCISVTQSAHKASLQTNNEHHFVTEKPAWVLLNQLIRTNPVLAEETFLKACAYKGCIKHEDDYTLLMQKRKQNVGKNLSISYRKKLKINKGALQYLYDDKGQTFIDCVNNVSHVGHCHPTVVKAIQLQAARLNTNTRYLHDNLVDYAAKLTATLPPHLSVCYFTNSGSEANDLAIRISRHYTRQKDIIVLDHAYHGTSTVAMEMSPYKFDGKGGFGKMPWIHKAENPDTYRGRYKKQEGDAGKKYARDVKRIIDDLQSEAKAPAAFICETLLGVGGQMPLPDNYLQEVYKWVKQAGGLCIADEVQVGFGRVGRKFWGFELQDCLPDIVVLGKPIGNGHPLAAVITTQEIANAFNNGMEYFNTYGGNPVSMACGLAVLNTIEEEELQQHALKTGKLLLEGLNRLKEKYALIGDVRGEGLFIGAELVRDRITLEPADKELSDLVEYTRDRGFLLGVDGPLNNVIKIKPPLVFSAANAQELIACLDEAFAHISLVSTSACG